MASAASRLRCTGSSAAMRPGPRSTSRCEYVRHSAKTSRAASNQGAMRIARHVNGCCKLHAMRLDFTKMHGLGNDFIVFDAPGDGALPTPEQWRALSARNTGIGFDQALVL